MDRIGFSRQFSFESVRKDTLLLDEGIITYGICTWRTLIPPSNKHAKAKKNTLLRPVLYSPSWQQKATSTSNQIDVDMHGVGDGHERKKGLWQFTNHDPFPSSQLRSCIYPGRALRRADRRLNSHGFPPLKL